MTTYHRVEHVLPANNERFMQKAAESEADVLFLDLEDAVATSAKVPARQTLVDAVKAIDFRGKKVFVRPNNLRARWAAGDYYTVVRAIGDKISGVVLPKITGARDIEVVDGILTAIEAEKGWPAGKLKIEALIEGPSALIAVEKVAQAIAQSGRAGALIFGLVDYLAATGGRPQAQEQQFLYAIYAKQRILRAARAAGLEAIDGVSVHVKNYPQTKADAIQSAKMGFTGKWSLHPEQIRAILDAHREQPFAPSRAYRPDQKPVRAPAPFPLTQLQELAETERPILAPEPLPVRPVAARRSLLRVDPENAAALKAAFDSAADEIVLAVGAGSASARIAGRERALAQMVRMCARGRNKRIALLCPADPTGGDFDMRALLDALGDPSGAERFIHSLQARGIERPQQAQALDRYLSEVEKSAPWDRDPGARLGIEILIESMKALDAADELAAASPRVECLIAALPSAGQDFYAKGALLAAAAACGIDAIAGLNAESRHVASDAGHMAIMGYSGKLIERVEEVPLVNEIFSPWPESIERALEIVELYRQADVERGLGALVYVDKRKPGAQEELIDAATVKVERRILGVADQAGLFTPEQRTRYQMILSWGPGAAGITEPLVARLSDRNAPVREQAAERLYAQGAARVASVQAIWDQDARLKGLIAGPPTVGLAVEPERFQAIRAAWGNPPLSDVPPEQDTDEFEIQTDEAHLDILTPRRVGLEPGPIDKFLARQGEGIQQVELLTRDAAQATQILFERAEQTGGPKPIYPAPRAGANGTQVNFILMPLPEGGKLLVELVQLACGFKATGRPRAVTDRDARIFAKYSGDRNPFHLDEDYAKRSRYGGRIAHGMLTVGFIIADLAHWAAGYDIESLEITRFSAPVKIGDRIYPHAEVLESEGGRLRLKVGARGEGGTERCEGYVQARWRGDHPTEPANRLFEMEPPRGARGIEPWTRDVAPFAARPAPDLQIGDRRQYRGDQPESAALHISAESYRAAGALFGAANPHLPALVGLGALAHTSAAFAPGYILLGVKARPRERRIQPGDTLTTQATVTDTRTTTSGKTVVTIGIEIINQKDEPVLSGEVTKLKAG